ncbi:hypothetical protein QEK82_001547 [Stenotrophomonas maltophilia]|uniref:hypothetical protein n=1 Tax=Stenotrophomonas maltophilia group sp. Smal13 TaxID=3377166 RepID=UPI0013124D6B|nr:hypothetical protein [Stenotrophomonas maltophilia]EKU9957627.1 hypothetical protein [Stenotrophomonas maltophilia]EKU9984749.1 hypothetical protein [Stenotrophomonas maltophilia]HEL4234660.1 hypothetical protein [Stenotrophomonas maltophilia]
MNALVISSEQEELEILVSGIWNDCIGSINDVLAGHRYFGFTHFATYADPSIADIVNSIRLIDAALNTMLDTDTELLSFECRKTLENCQQSMHLIRRVHMALKFDNQAEYDEAVAKLSSQRQH